MVLKQKALFYYYFYSCESCEFSVHCVSEGAEKGNGGMIITLQSLWDWLIWMDTSKLKTECQLQCFWPLNMNILIYLQAANFLFLQIQIKVNINAEKKLRDYQKAFWLH